MDKKLIMISALVVAALGMTGYFCYKYFLGKRVAASSILLTVGDVSLSIPAFEEFVKVGEKEWGNVDPERNQKYYYLLWENMAIEAWNNKHRIDQTPAYKEDVKVFQERLKKHPKEPIVDRKSMVRNKLKCMLHIECWLRDINNYHFLHNFPLFKPYIEKNKLNLEQLRALKGQMILDLSSDLKTTENVEYLKRNNIKGIENLRYEISHRVRKTS